MEISEKESMFVAAFIISVCIGYTIIVLSQENEIGPVPFFFVGDDAFQSLTNLVKPFSEDAKRLLEDEIMTNYRISR